MVATVTMVERVEGKEENGMKSEKNVQRWQKALPRTGFEPVT